MKLRYETISYIKQVPGGKLSLGNAMALKTSLIYSLLLFTSYSNCFSHVQHSVEIFPKVLVGAANFFNSACVYFTASNEFQPNVQTVKTQKILSDKLVSSSVLSVEKSDIERSHGLLHDCHNRMFTVFNVENTRGYLEMLSKVNKLRRTKWLLYLYDSVELDQYFLNINIPFDCEFLVVNPVSSDGLVLFTEIYRVVEHGSLQKHNFGFWSLKNGFVGTNISFYERRNNLHGIKFITTNNEEDAPISYLHKDEGDNRMVLGGFSGHVWYIFEQHMNFRSEHRVPADGMWGTLLDNGSWDGMIGDLLHNVANMTAIGITVTSERADYVSFTTPLFFSYVQIYIREPGQQVSLWGLISPFRPALWFALIFSVVALSLILTLLHHLDGNKDYVERHHLFKDIFFHFFGAMFCQQGLVRNPQAFSKRIVIFVIYVVGMITLSSYSGSVISYLAVTKYNLPFSSLHGFLDDGTYSLGMVKTTWYHDLFKNAQKHGQSLDIQELYSRFVRTDQENTPNTYEDGFRRACDVRYGFITEEEAFYSMDWNCTLRSLPNHFSKTSISYAFPKSSPYLGLFNHNLLKLMNSGVLRKLYKDALNRNIPIETGAILPAADLGTVLPILSVLGAGYLVSLIILAWEILTSHSVA